ncbi:SgcJ/EcaC family oxidoreductase [Kineococcus sp. R8]|uniref:YybH family protein n=1 Tax=Kineococcus siccus TaxID=2696567 RepID=UPI00196AEB18|nr:nuclear transport factor 2 family protein [Kineococcus siccus]NAZ80421.1 SgcJ/EcaC family oxidoreductase [Kineococcus siccus]
MTVTTTTTTTWPDDLADAFRSFERHFAAGDFDAIAEQYGPDAVLVWAPGERAEGRAAIRAAFEAAHARGAGLTMEPRAFHIAGDLAVTSFVITFTGMTPDGSPVVTTSTEVLRRGTDGRWRFEVDDPFFSA